MYRRALEYLPPTEFETLINPNTSAVRDPVAGALILLFQVKLNASEVVRTIPIHHGAKRGDGFNNARGIAGRSSTVFL